MAFTYDGTLDTDLEKVRLAIGDTVQHPQLSLSDAEIQLRIDETGHYMAAAVRCARDRVARASIFATRSAAGVNADRNAVVENLRQILTRLEKDAASQGGTIQVDAGMLSQSTIDATKEDTDYPDAPFSVGMDDDPGSRPDDKDTIL